MLAVCGNKDFSKVQWIISVQNFSLTDSLNFSLTDSLTGSLRFSLNVYCFGLFSNKFQNKNCISINLIPKQIKIKNNSLLMCVYDEDAEDDED